MALPLAWGVFPATSRPVFASVTISRGPCPSGGRCDGSVGSDSDFDGAPFVPVLDDVDLAAGRMDADSEALDVVIPDHPLAFGREQGIDGSLGDFGHGGNPSLVE